MFKNNRLNKLSASLSLATVLSLLAGVNSVTLAQSSSENDGYQSNEKSGAFGGAPSGLDPVELMHRAQQANSRSADEFNEDTRMQLDNSVSDFKRQQQQRILEQRQQVEIAPLETPQSNR